MSNTKVQKGDEFQIKSGDFNVKITAVETSREPLDSHSIDYSNWGLRTGIKELKYFDIDAAFSPGIPCGLFSCNGCNTKSMLVPTEDFSGLKCSACGHEISFDTIRKLSVGIDEVAT